MVGDANNWKFNFYGSGVTPQEVLNWIAIARIPITATYDANVPIIMSNQGTYGTWPVPGEDYAFIVVVDTSTISGGAVGMGRDKRCSVAKTPDSSWSLGNRLWHELLHAIDKPADALNPRLPSNLCTKFCHYASADSRWAGQEDIVSYCADPYIVQTNEVLKAFYTMLWESDENQFCNSGEIVCSSGLQYVCNDNEWIGNGIDCSTPPPPPPPPPPPSTDYTFLYVCLGFLVSSGAAIMYMNKRKRGRK